MKIRKLRKAQGKTLEQLAQISGVSAGLLSQVERGQGNPSFSTLVQIAPRLGGVGGAAGGGRAVGLAGGAKP